MGANLVPLFIIWRINMRINSNVVCPNYLCYDTLPYAADIFYHGNLTYFLPIGITPYEWENVIEFPEYCAERNIAMPRIIWEMQDKYFECSKQAVECSKILEPLELRILKANAIYPRDINAILKCRKELSNTSGLLECFSKSADDLNFLTRELFSHVFLDVHLEGGFGLVKEYLEENFQNQETTIELLAAVTTNRIKRVFCNEDMNYFIYNHSWYPFLMELLKEEENFIDKKSIGSVDPAIHRLFTEIVSPIFGKCDSREKTEYIARIVEKQGDAIIALKNICKEIIQTSMFYENEKVDLRDEKLKSLLAEKVIEPLGYMMSKPKNDVKKALTDFVLDSTVISGVLGMLEGFSPFTVGVSAVAGSISVGLKYLIDEKKNNKCTPTRLLVEGLKKNKIEYLQYENALKELIFWEKEKLI